MPKWLPLMRTGEFTDRFGNLHKITVDILDRIQKNHTNDRRAHLVVGHPHPDKELSGTVPTFGFVDKLKRIGDTLFFRPADVVAEFAQLVSKGMFRDVSAGLDSGLTTLRHVALLSAEKPAIDGLAPICEFSAENDGVIDINVSEIAVDGLAEFSAISSEVSWRFRNVGSMMRGLRDFIIEKFDLEAANKVLPDYMVTNLQEPLPEESSSFTQFSSSKGGNMDLQKALEELAAERQKIKEFETKVAEFSSSITTLTSERDELITKVNALTGRVSELSDKNTTAEFSEFVEKLIVDKKLHPSKKEDTVKELVNMHKASLLAEFSEGTSPLEIFKKQLESATAIEIPDDEHQAHKQHAEFSAGSGAKEKAVAMKNYMSEQEKLGNNVSPMEALAHVNAKLNG